MYISEVKEDLMNFDFIVPEFFNKDKFRINKELINNKLTKEYINESSKIEYIFKVILGSFNKKRKKNRLIGVFTESTIDIFNNFVESINKIIDIHLKKSNETEMANKGLLDFNDFFEIEIDTDADGDVYPDVYDELVAKNLDKKGKKGGKEMAIDYIKKDKDQF